MAQSAVVKKIAVFKPSIYNMYKFPTILQAYLVHKLLQCHFLNQIFLYTIPVNTQNLGGSFLSIYSFFLTFQIPFKADPEDSEGEKKTINEILP